MTSKIKNALSDDRERRDKLEVMPMLGTSQDIFGVIHAKRLGKRAHFRAVDGSRAPFGKTQAGKQVQTEGLLQSPRRIVAETSCCKVTPISPPAQSRP
jgi:hypothetical protein